MSGISKGGRFGKGKPKIVAKKNLESAFEMDFEEKEGRMTNLEMIVNNPPPPITIFIYFGYGVSTYFILKGYASRSFQSNFFRGNVRDDHFVALKRILRYVRGTLDYGLQLYASPTTYLIAYSDADRAGCLTTRRSTSGYCVFLDDNLLSWSSKRQHTISRSSAKAEYRGVANDMLYNLDHSKSESRVFTFRSKQILVNVGEHLLSTCRLLWKELSDIDEVKVKDLAEKLSNFFRGNVRDDHFVALKRILRYVRGTLDYGLQLYASPTTYLIAYSDADRAGCPTTRRSTSGYCVFLGDNLLSWSSKRQHTISRSSAEAEYRGVANDVAETAWTQNLLLELHAPLQSTTLI
nr:ribonuclease H-like domain-containing protein [Tanacetum cinerariifolium]